MRTAIARVALVALAMSASALSACSEPPTGPKPPTVVPPPPLPTVKSLTSSVGSVSLTPGATVQTPVVTATMSDNTTKVVTPESWTTTNSSVVVVTANTVIAVNAGEAMLTASYQGFTAGVSVTVTSPPVPQGTPWSELPYISPGSKVYLEKILATWSGYLVTWKPREGVRQRYTVWQNPEIPLAELSAAVEEWTKKSGNRDFVLITDSAGADVLAWFDDVAITAPRCGGAEVTRDGYAITRVRIQLASRPACAGQGILRLHIAHEMGHGMGLPHTAEGVNIMSPAPVWVFDQVVTETADWMAVVPPGTKPIQAP